MKYHCDVIFIPSVYYDNYVIIYISSSPPLVLNRAQFADFCQLLLFSQRQVESCSSIMVVVTSLGPPEEGIRHTQEAVATFVNRSVGSTTGIRLERTF